MSRPWGRAEQTRLDGWLALADRGWRLFPVRPGTKVPAISRWSQRATSDPERLDRFFREHPDHNAGIACGPSGLLVVDCDIPKDDRATTRWVDGSAVFDDLAALHGGAPETWTVATPSGGRHLYYAAPGDRVLGNTSRVLGPLLDTRGDGGQVLATGSVLPSGGYELLDDSDPAPLPGWLATRLTSPSATSVPASARAMGDVVGRPLTARQTAYVTSAVGAETERVRRAGRGGHNTAIFTAANALGQLVGSGALDRVEAEAAITAAAGHICAGPCDCTSREVAASIRSGLDRGSRNPRRLPGGTTHPGTRDLGDDAMNTPEDATPAVPYEPAQPGRIPPERASDAALQPADVYTDADLAAIAEALAGGDEQELDRFRARPSGDPVLLSMPAAREDAAAVVGLECPECGEDAVEQTPDTLVPYAAHERAVPRYAHSDGEPLCPVVGPSGYESAQPREVLDEPPATYTIPGQRSSAAPAGDEPARREQLARWHDDDQTTTSTADGGMER